MTEISAASSVERLERLVTAGTMLMSELSLEGVLERTAEMAAEIIGARYAAIGVLGPDGRMLESFTTHGVTADERARIGAPPKGHGILGLVVREARVIRLPDLTKHPDSFGFPPNHPPMNSFLGVPIIGRRGSFGNLYLTEKLGGGEFTDADERIARLLAAQTAAVVENARLHEESAQLIEEVQQLQRSRERFFATVNHELRNALAAVYGWAEMLVRKKDPASVPPAALEVLDSAEQAVALINDLLDLSRLDEDRLRPVMRVVDCGTVLRRAASRLTPAAHAKDVALVLDTPTRGVAARTDSNRMEQILTNLLGNAIRHTPPGTRVHLTLMESDGVADFVVRDEGMGVPEQDLEEIFDIYVTKAGDEAGGHGLGLPLSRRLARLLGGELTAESNPGAGGVFRLRLPLAPEPAPDDQL